MYLDRRLKLLFVTPYLPHPQAGHGTGVFMYGLLKQLAPNHEITIISFCNKEELALAPDLDELPLKVITISRGRGVQVSFWWNVRLVITRFWQAFRGILHWIPYYASKYWHPRMQKAVVALTSGEDFDVVQLEMSQMGQYATAVKKGAIVLHEHDVSMRPAYRRFRQAKSGFSKILAYIEWCRWSFFERRVANKVDHVLCVTEQDLRLLQRLSGVDKLSYFPRGVDIPPMIPAYSVRNEKTILFVGTFAHQPNVDAASWLIEDIFPRVLSKVPGTKLLLAGPNFPKYLASRASRYQNIEILGFVEDLESYFRSAAVFIAPLRFGGGVKVKVLHAMANGMPTVGTRLAFEGIDGISGENVLIGETADRLSQHVEFLLTHPQEAERRGFLAWQAMSEFYSWDRTTRRLEEIYKTKVIH